MLMKPSIQLQWSSTVGQVNFPTSVGQPLAIIYLEPLPFHRRVTGHGCKIAVISLRPV